MAENMDERCIDEEGDPCKHSDLCNGKEYGWDGCLVAKAKIANSGQVQRFVIKPCPFCGDTPREGEYIGQKHLESKLFETAKCINLNCPIYGIEFLRDAWQKRSL